LELGSEQPRRRVSDTSAAEARRAVEATLQRFGGWRDDLASFAVRVERRFSESERTRMLERCAAIEAELREAREDLLGALIDAPRSVAGHSRVEDVEKALDGVEATLGVIRGKLG
jgi:hypothetical protein